MFPDTMDICHNAYSEDEDARQASIEAHASIVQSKEALRQKIQDYLRLHHSATADEVSIAFGNRHSTIGARFTELKANGLIVGHERRKTSSGRYAIAYNLVDNTVKEESV